MGRLTVIIVLCLILLIMGQLILLNSMDEAILDIVELKAKSITTQEYLQEAIKDIDDIKIQMD